jgi:hypothetical protein
LVTVVTATTPKAAAKPAITKNWITQFRTRLLRKNPMLPRNRRRRDEQLPGTPPLD